MSTNAKGEGRKISTKTLLTSGETYCLRFQQEAHDMKYKFIGSPHISSLLSALTPDPNPVLPGQMHLETCVLGLHDVRRLLLKWIGGFWNR